MLDQNTDRMWYVIGAVLLGAAILLLLNGTAPELFASVGGQLQETTDQATEDVAEMTEPPHEDVPIANHDFSQGGDHWTWRFGRPDFTSGTAKIPGGADMWVRTGIHDPSTVQVQFKARGSGSVFVRFGNHDRDDRAIVEVAEDFDTYTVTIQRQDYGNHQLLFLTLEESAIEIDDVKVRVLTDE